MKKFAFCLFPALALTSCTENPPPIPPGFEEKTVCLVDSFPQKTLAFVKLAVPVELDTFLNWTDFSDCSPCCDAKKYRFISSSGCLIKESGFLKRFYCRDSIQRFTIIHTDWGCGNDTKIDTTMINAVAKSIESDNTPVQWKRKGIQKVNSRDFALYHYIGSDYYAAGMEIMAAVTPVQGNLIVFHWECAGYNDCRAFIRKAFQTLASIQIDTTCRQ